MATCSGDQSGGIAVGADFLSPPVDTLNVNNLGPNGIAPVAGLAGINFIGSSPGGITINADTAGTAGITTAGDPAPAVHSSGINAEKTGEGDLTIWNNGRIKAVLNGIKGKASGQTGDVRISNTGDISGFGEGIWGWAAGRGDVIIENAGAIASRFNGIGASAGGTTSKIIITNSGDISRYVRAGISADTLGDIEITNTGSIGATLQNGSMGDEGILASAFGHSSRVRVTNHGDITVFNNGIDAGSSGSVDVVNSGHIRVTLGAGITVLEGNNVSINNSGNIFAYGVDFGEYPRGIEVESSGPDATIFIATAATSPPTGAMVSLPRTRILPGRR